jgi:phage baseplate assembly protein V
MSDESDAAIKNMLRRATLVEVDDAKGQQRVRVKGLSGEELRDVYRYQTHGFTSTPVVGAVGLIANLGGRSDRAVLLGLESEDLRPKNIGVGGSAIYDHTGNIVSVVQPRTRIIHSTEIVIQAGGTTLTINAAGLIINGIRVEHDGKDIGKTHTHSGVTPGGANTNVPNP